MLDELLQHFEEDALGVFHIASGEAADDLIFDDVEQEVELVSFAQKLQGNHYHLQVVLLIEQVVDYLRHLLYLPQLLVYVFD